MPADDLLQSGIDAVKRGDNSTAANLLIQVVKADPSSELGWLWLGYARNAPDQREYCFRRVLGINPLNKEAQQQLEYLKIGYGTQQGGTPLAVSQPPPPAISEPQKNVQPPMDKKKSQERSTQKRPIPKERIWLISGGVGAIAILCLGALGIWLFRSLNSQASNVVPQPTIPPPPVITPTPNYQPIFEPSECTFVKPFEVQVTCGYVRVPEDRTGDLTDTIQLAVAIYHSQNESPKPDPILYLQGGPGGKAISWSLRSYESVIAPLIAERDFIVFDPRGVGYSSPTLNCDAVKTTYLNDIQGKLPADQKNSYYEGAMLTCMNDFNKLGVNPSAYTSVQMATDARDVILALGYSQANLYGISYGTRVAQFVMRAHPEVVRTVILDSVVPVETQLFRVDSGAEHDRLIRLLFEECAADATCASAYPNLGAIYEETYSLLQSNPVQISLRISREETVERSINGDLFRNTIVWGLRHPQTIAAIPNFVYRTHAGDYSQLNYAAAIPLITFDTITIGSYIAVNCHDQIFAIPTEGLDASIYDLCGLWGVEPPAAGENDPIHSAIPTLIIAGRYDSTTPTTFASQLASHLEHSYLVEIPNQGHAPSATGISDCPGRIILSFLNEPDIPPDSNCVTENSQIDFVIPFNPDSPITLEPVVIDKYGVTALTPTSWTQDSYGFFHRLGSMGDITQIGIQRAAVSESEWAVWLQTNFRGNQGLDRPAVKVSSLQANGLNWTIYQTASLGYPIDIAFAKSGNDTLMVLLMSHQDEREALYNAIFLQTVNSVIPIK